MMSEGKTIGQLMEEMRAKAGAQNYHGHGYMDLQRFAEDTRHMIIFDVLTNDSPVGWKGERTRLFLSDTGYEKALDSQEKGQIKILSHAKVRQGNLHYDHSDQLRYFEFRSSYTKIIEDKQEALLRVKKEMKQTVTTGTTERNWVTLFKQYENVEELNRRVLMSLVDRILIHENHAIEIVFKYRDEYQQTIEYVLGYADELDIAV